MTSSYTPLIGALRHARRPSSKGPDRSLIVAMPTTPGLKRDLPLPYAAAEAAALRLHLPRPTVLVEPPVGDTPADPERLPTRSQVFAHLTEATIAHFSCHGHDNPVTPSRSRLLLHDHDTYPLTVASLAPLELSHARLAYLSACSTAITQNQNLLDEAVHLAAGFQLAGFPHVIGTLWPILDATAAAVANDFYLGLTDPDGTLHPERAAQAIHRAIRIQRDALPTTPRAGRPTSILVLDTTTNCRKEVCPSSGGESAELDI